jgi:gamma-glutamylcyclotransferase (GGCT)/AIG2-like uncharacterized protein YtfP
MTASARHPSRSRAGTPGGPRPPGPAHRLAVYGSLAPGEANADQLAGLEGEWLEGGRVRGRLHRAGWGAAHGFPGLEWDPGGGPVPVKVFVSADLPAHWARLDAFEGSDYRRIVVPVEGLPGGTRPCNIYVIAEPGPLRRPG